MSEKKTEPVEGKPGPVPVRGPITGAGSVAPDYALSTEGDHETRAGSVAPNYAVSTEATPLEPVEIVEAPESTDAK